MLPSINPYDKCQEIRIFIYNSRMQVIGRVIEADEKEYDINTGSVNELTFKIPLYIDNLQTGLEKNKNADLLVDRCLLKVKYGNLEEFFVIDNHQDDDSTIYRNIHAYSIGYQLNDKLIKNYTSQASVTTNGVTSMQDSPISIQDALKDALMNSPTWSVGYIDPAFSGMYRFFQFDSQTALEYVYQIGTSFNAIITWDTINKKVNAYHPDYYGTDKGFKITDEKYISTLTKKSTTDTFATRLYLYGKDGLTINSISATGQSYIEDFSYFMNNGMMSQDLINGLTNYNNYVLSRQNDFPTLLANLNQYQSDMQTLQSDLATLQSTQSTVQNALDIINAAGEKTNVTYTITTANKTGTTNFTDTNKRLFLFTISDTVNETPTITHNGTTVTQNSGTYAAKVDGNSVLTFSNFSGTITVNGFFLQITIDDYNLSMTDLQAKYDINLANVNVTAKQSQITAKQSQIDSTNASIKQLNNDLLITNHLTTAQYNELDQFIICKEYSDDNLTDAQSLLDSGKTQLKERNTPEIVFDVSLVNFLNCLEEKRNWDKIEIFDIVRIQSEKLNIDIKARIVNIKITNDNIGLTIANSKDVKDEPDKFIQLLYGTATGTSSLQAKAGVWDDASKVKGQFNDYINSAIDATKQMVVAGINENVQIYERGIKVTSPTDINTFLIINHGVIAITRDGGNTWSNAINENGVVADMVVGKLLVGANLIIQNEQGTFNVDGGNVTITGASPTTKILINSTDGVKIQTSPDNGVTWVDKFYVDSSGVLNAKGMKITSDDGSAVMIDAKNKLIDFSQFTETVGKIDGVFINLGQSKGDGVLQVWGDSNGDGQPDVIGRIGMNTASFPTVRADNIIGNVVNVWNGGANVNVYFDTVNGNDSNDGTSYSSAKQNVQSFINSMARNLNGAVVIINVRGDVTGGLYVNNFFNGSLLITGDQTSGAPRYKLYGYISFSNCIGGHFMLQDFDLIWDSSANTTNKMFQAFHCSYVECYSVKCYGGSTANHGFWFEDCRFQLGECHVYNITDRGLYATSLSHGYVLNVHGSAPVAIISEGGSIITGNGYRWGGSLIRWDNAILGSVGSDNTSWQLDVWTVDLAEAATAPPPTPAAPTKSTLTVSASTGDNWSSSGYWTNDEVKQGNAGYGARYGIWYFSLGAIKGKTISSAKLTFYRNTGSGASAAETAYIRSHPYGSRSSRPASLSGSSYTSAYGHDVSIAAGQTVTVDITDLIQHNIASGSDNSLGIWDTGSSNYMSLGTTPTLNIAYS